MTIPAFDTPAHIATKYEAQIGAAMLKFHGVRRGITADRRNGQFGMMQQSHPETSLVRVFKCLTNEYQSGADIAFSLNMRQGTVDAALRKMRSTVQVDFKRADTSTGKRYLYRKPQGDVE